MKTHDREARRITIAQFLSYAPSRHQDTLNQRNVQEYAKVALETLVYGPSPQIHRGVVWCGNHRQAAARQAVTEGTLNLNEEINVEFIADRVRVEDVAVAALANNNGSSQTRAAKQIINGLYPISQKVFYPIRSRIKTTWLTAHAANEFTLRLGILFNECPNLTKSLNRQTTVSISAATLYRAKVLSTSRMKLVQIEPTIDLTKNHGFVAWMDRVSKWADEMMKHLTCVPELKTSRTVLAYCVFSMAMNNSFALKDCPILARRITRYNNLKRLKDALISFPNDQEKAENIIMGVFQTDPAADDELRAKIF